MPVPCDGGAEEDVLDLDSPWVAAAEADSRLEKAAMAAAAAGLHLREEDEADADEIRDNQQRQEDEVGLLKIKLEFFIYLIYDFDLSCGEKLSYIFSISTVVTLCLIVRFSAENCIA
jgi:hypothetical protein